MCDLYVMTLLSPFLNGRNNPVLRPVIPVVSHSTQDVGAVLWLSLPPVVEPHGGDVGMPEPLLHLLSDRPRPLSRVQLIASTVGTPVGHRSLHRPHREELHLRHRLDSYHLFIDTGGHVR
jgi:hypothetical protein